MMSKLHSMWRMASLATLAIYAIGWIIGTAGLALSQKFCKDNIDTINSVLADAPYALHYPLVSHETGENCSKLYRLPWFLWIASLVPVLIALAHVVMPRIVHPYSSILQAALLTFQILATDVFLQLQDHDASDLFSKFDTANKVAMAGFLIMAAMSLLLSLIHLLEPRGHVHDHHHDGHVTHKDADGRANVTGGHTAEKV